MRAALLAVMLAAACHNGPPAGGGGSGSASTEPRTDCAKSEDCALVQACCGCNEGGRQIAIRADAVAAFDASRPQRCGHQLCAMHISNDPSCSAEAICGGDGHCKVAPHAQSGDPDALPPAGPAAQ
jgi:hypothetical protein